MPARVIGRERELAAIEAFLERAEGGSATLVFEGDAGIGKTALWREALQRAEDAGLLVLTARPAEAEAQVSYAALNDLLGTVADSAIATLPPAQRQALEIALLRSTVQDVHVEPLAIAAGTRSALADAARDRPVVVAIDDVQWLDSASAAALTYALRRVEEQRVSVLATRRLMTSRRRISLELPDAQVVQLEGLSVGAIQNLVTDRLDVSLRRPLLIRLHQACGGNPLYALELARELERSSLRPGDPLPVPGDLRQVVRRRLARLSPAVRDALLVAAAAGEPTPALLAAVAHADPSPPLEEAALADVIALEGDRITFTHPLYAAAIYAAALPAQRAQVHLSLAEAAADAEERARHLALGTTSPSAAVAAELEQAAVTAKHRGRLLAAGTLLAEAARVTPAGEGPERHRRQLAAADALEEAGDADGARELVERLRSELPSGPLRARASLLLARIQSAADEETAAKQSTLEAIEDAASDSRLLAEAHLHFVLVCFDDAAAWRQSAATARALVENDPGAPPDLVAAALLDDAYQGLYAGEGLPVERVERAIAALPQHGRTWVAQRARAVAFLWAKYTDDLVRARELVLQTMELDREHGRDYEADVDLLHLSEIECWLGNWRAAEELAPPAAASSRMMFGLYIQALVAVHLGDVAPTRECVAAGLAMCETNAWGRVMHLSVLGFLELSLGDAEAAALQLDAAANDLGTIGMAEPARFRFEGDHIEALVAADRVAEAKVALERLARRRAVTPRPWTLVMCARGEALVRAADGDIAGAADAIETALREHDRLPMPFERARTLLVAGQIRRRAGERRAAKETLEEALAEFDRLGAPLWSTRAEAELRRIPIRRRAGGGLTPTERRVAELAAEGRTNREVAQALFMSPKTVEANLARAYRKLGIRSRAELGRTMAAGGQDQAAAKP
jgi:DNA-binding CsgD family transcriptional regulator